MVLAALFLQAEHVHEHMQNMAHRPDAKSLFDHHLAGAVIVLLGVLFFLERSLALRYRLIRYLWPLSLLGLATFLLIWSDTKEPWGHWILRGEFAHTEVEHKLMEAAAILVALIELSVRAGWLKHLAWPQVINALLLSAGLILFFHHGLHSHLVHMQHYAMATVIIAVSLVKAASDFGWGGRWAGLYAVPLLLVTLGVQFALYVE